MSFRRPELLERRDDVEYRQTGQPFAIADGPQERHEVSFTINRSTAIDPLDWYDARLALKISLQSLAAADGGGNNNAAIDDCDDVTVQGIVNGSHTWIKKVLVYVSGVDDTSGVSVYNNNEADWSTTVKNLVDYSTPFVESIGGSQLFYPDTTITTLDANIGFITRRALLATAANSVDVEIPLNRYGFFEAFEEVLMSNMRVELKIDFNTDDNVVWRRATRNDAGGVQRNVPDAKGVIGDVKLVIPKRSTVLERTLTSTT